MILELLCALSLSAGPRPDKPRAEAPERREKGSSLTAGAAFSAGIPFGSGATWFKGGPRLGVELPLDPRFTLGIEIPINLAGSSQPSNVSTINAIGFELVPGARLSWTAIPKLRLYAEAGAGISAYQYTVQIPILGTGSNGAAGAAFRFAAGLDFEVADHLLVSLEPFGLLGQTVESATWTIRGATYHSGTPLPLQWVSSLGLSPPAALR